MSFLRNLRQQKAALWELSSTSADISAATGTLVAVSLPDRSLVFGVYANCLTAITGSSAEEVGDGTDVDGWVKDGFAATAGVYPLYAQVAGTTFVGAFATNLLAGATDAADVSNVPAAKYYASADTIDFKITGTATAGKVWIVVDFMCFNAA